MIVDRARTGRDHGDFASIARSAAFRGALGPPFVPQMSRLAQEVARRADADGMASKEHQRIERLLLDAVTVDGLVEQPVFTLPPEMPAARAAEELDALDFDSAPVADEQISHYVLRAILRGNSTKPVAELAQPILATDLIASSAGVPFLLERLRSREWLYVVGPVGIDRIVTRSDLRKPAVGAAIFALIISLETSLTDLVDIYTDGDWESQLNKDDRDAYLEVRAKRHEANEDLRNVDCLTLMQLLKLVCKSPRLRKDLGWSRRKLKSLTNALSPVRNGLAHSVSVLDLDSDVAKTIKTVLQISQLATKAGETLTAGQYVWEAFATSQIDRESEMAGRASSQPWHVITAWNPESRRQSDAANADANRRLAADLCSRPEATDSEPLGVRSRTGSWVEESLAVQGLDRSQAIRIGQRFGQRAIFEIAADSVVVVDCSNGVERSHRPVVALVEDVRRSEVSSVDGAPEPSDSFHP